MKFVVHSRANMIAAQPPQADWAVISICEKGDFPAIQENEFLKGRLNLRFHDTDIKRADNEILFNDVMAGQVLDFVQGLDVSVVYVHCLMGQSRSAAVAAALEKALNGDDSKYFRPGPYKPNMLVFRRVLDECHERGLI